MICKNFKSIILTAFVVFLRIANAAAQTIPRNVEINAYHSLESSQTLDMKAYETISIREGFKMAPGSSLKLMVVPKDISNSIVDKDAEQLVVYPNPSTGKITIQGSFNNDELVIYDRTGNPATQIIINGENPVVDLSGLKNEVYIIKVLNKAVRLIKN